MAPRICAVVNALAAVMLLAVRDGTELEPDVARRAGFIAEHALLWRATWATWMASALTLLWFYGWWGGRGTAFWIAAIGVGFDLSAEALYMFGDIESVQRIGSIMTGGVANGLYSVAGAMLSSTLRGWPRAWAWAIWTSGFGLTAATLAGSAMGMAIASGALMALFCPWTFFIGPKLR